MPGDAANVSLIVVRAIHFAATATTVGVLIFRAVVAEPAVHSTGAVRRVVMNAVDVEEGPEVFPQEVEVAFNAAYDKLLRALDGLELSRDLLASVRDYSQAKVANDQNEVMKRLTVVASLLLPPTFIVGVYGQNFRNIPELRWSFGYAYVWGVIVVITVLQVLWFRRNNWM